ncbi:MAG: type VI secretion system baseplate subunit TssG [Tangfeifania sp.]
MNLERKSERINSLLLDLRAEYLVSTLLEEGMKPNEILVSFNGVLKRNWSHDISHAVVEEFQNGKDALGIHLNRPGVYDALPEALFHRFLGSTNISGSEMAKQSMKLRAEEKQVRAFFRPFENEVFLQSAMVANVENQEIGSLHSDFLDALSPGFWKIKEKIPKKYLSALIRFLPFVHRICGNYVMTAQCLGKILGEKVEIRLKFDEGQKEKKEKANSEFSAGKLGSSKLGADLIVGEKASGFLGELVMEIGPLQNSKPEDYFPNGPADRFLNCFEGFFIPVELDVGRKIVIQKEQKSFTLRDEHQETISYLGYNTVLQ